jgi:hypothetical protein
MSACSGVDGEGCGVGARLDGPGRFGWKRQRVGGAVKAGPLGPPGGGALRAPGFQLSPATMAQ